MRVYGIPNRNFLVAGGGKPHPLESNCLDVATKIKIPIPAGNMALVIRLGNSHLLTNRVCACRSDNTSEAATLELWFDISVVMLKVR
jgi:hypothetical protein